MVTVAECPGVELGMFSISCFRNIQTLQGIAIAIQACLLLKLLIHGVALIGLAVDCRLEIFAGNLDDRLAEFCHRLRAELPNDLGVVRGVYLFGS